MLLTFAATALAQSPADTQYDPSHPPSELAFTGLDAVTFAAIGVALVGVGLVVRRMTRTRHDLS